MRRYKVIHRYSKTAIIFRVKPVSERIPKGFLSELDGVIQSKNLENAARSLRLILIRSFKDAGFVWKVPEQ